MAIGGGEVKLIPTSNTDETVSSRSSGHLKNDGLMFRNFLKGFPCGKTHAVLCGVGLKLEPEGGSKEARPASLALGKLAVYYDIFLAAFWPIPVLKMESWKSGNLLVG